MESPGKLIALVALAATSGQPATASFDAVRIFSECAGTYAAAVEHAWLLGNGDIDALEGERAQTIDILSAVVSDERGREAYAVRVEARAAHRALLAGATFGTDPISADWARSRAAFQLGQCRRLLLDS